jgi:hypothetical protein
MLQRQTVLDATVRDQTFDIVKEIERLESP